MRTLAVFLFSFFAYYGYAQTGTEILLFDLHLGKNAVTVKDGVNISNRKGYDNQPFSIPTRRWFTIHPRIRAEEPIS